MALQRTVALLVGVLMLLDWKVLGVKNGEDVDRTHLPDLHYVPEPYNWMNDPNGLYYDPRTELYHLMFQYETPRTWGHAYSKDLLHWTDLPIALDTDEPYDEGGVYSGSTTLLDDGTPAILYSVWTNDKTCLAFPSNLADPYASNWSKVPENPVIDSTRDGAPDGRDPTTAWRHTVVDPELYYMCYGMSPGPNQGAAVTFSSPDFYTWTEQGYLHESNWTGFWECPDFFQIPSPPANAMVSHIFKVSLESDFRDYWTTGTYDEATVRFTPYSTMTDIGTPNQLIDYGTYYASKTFYDSSKDRQVLFGWIREERTVDDHGKPYGWAGAQSLPREISLGANGIRMLSYPIPEVASLRVEDSQQFLTWHVNEGDNLISVGPTGTTLDMELSVRVLDIPASIPGNYSVSCEVMVLATEDTAEWTSYGVMWAAGNWYMPNTEILADTYSVQPTSNDDPRECQGFCQEDANCFAYTYYQNGTCQLKGKTGPVSSQCTTCVSGIKSDEATTLSRLLYTNTIHSSLSTIDGHKKRYRAGEIPTAGYTQDQVFLRAVVDKSVLEVFAEKGEAVISRRTYPTRS
eukprot:CAMPEP_0119136656 /NCGR_PEP_ID=MMETSP1310-20130426/21877_1 /TAXON_ID=464262 /ORGANISM="Genus nov. species nov., Strain RCC2339" /LENGTH=573 /DNA_ID=CAMNT_0007127669 /DNA_START=99 /DNA_END=1817 /DNA_ORIENTATION=-